MWDLIINFWHLWRMIGVWDGRTLKMKTLELSWALKTNQRLHKCWRSSRMNDALAVEHPLESAMCWSRPPAWQDRQGAWSQMSWMWILALPSVVVGSQVSWLNSWATCLSSARQGWRHQLDWVWRWAKPLAPCLIPGGAWWVEEWSTCHQEVAARLQNKQTITQHLPEHQLVKKFGG